jgi:hypothetical protein
MSGPEGIEENLTPLSTGPGGNILQIFVAAPMISKFMAILQGKGKNSNLQYVHTCISIHSSTHKSGYTRFHGAQHHTNLLGLVLRASATAASAPEVDAFVP